MIHQPKKIGIFDSGIGGLTILKPLIKSIPANYIYLADTAHLPYGDKTAETIISYAMRIASFFNNEGIDTCIIACHTVSALAQPLLKNSFPSITFIGVLEEVCKAAARETKNKTVGIIATHATISHHGHQRLLNQLEPSIKIIEQACPELVPTIETIPLNVKQLTSLLDYYLKPFKEHAIDTLILGCTHYALIKEHIQKITGDSVMLIGAEKFVVQQVHKKIRVYPTLSVSITCLTTSEPSFFDIKARKLTNLELPKAQCIQLP